MSQAPDDPFARHLDLLRSGVRIIALRALADADLADEVAQETVARVLAAVQNGRVRSPENLGAFARGVARHVIADVIRERERRQGLEALEATLGDPPTSEADPLDALVKLETSERVRAALSQLSPRDRELLRLSYFEGLKPAQIAERMGEAATRVRMRKSRALDRLRRAFEEAAARRYEPRLDPTKERGQEHSPATRSGGAEKK